MSKLLCIPILLVSWLLDPAVFSGEGSLHSLSAPHGPETIAMLPGIAEPAQQADLSPPLSGVLVELRVREGSLVSEGDIIAVLDNRVALAELRVAQAASARTAAVEQAKAELRSAESFLARLRTLEASRAVAASEIDQAVSARDRAAATLSAAQEQLVAARHNLSLAETRVDLHNIRAPFAGRILRIDVRPGETIAETDSPIRMADMLQLQAELHVPIRWYEKLITGQSYMLAAASPVDRAVSAKLVFREPVINAATQTFRCVFRLDNPGEKLLAGFSVRLIQPE